MPELTTVISVRGKDRRLLLANESLVYVGRRCGQWPASIWGNPWKPKDFDDGAAGCLAWYREAVEAIYWENEASAGRPHPDNAEALYWEVCKRTDARDMRRIARAVERLPELRGKVLGCWCCTYDGVSEQMPLCHAAILARICNGLEVPRAR